MAGSVRGVAEPGVQEGQLAGCEGGPVEVESTGQAVELGQRGEPPFGVGERFGVAPDRRAEAQHHIGRVASSAWEVGGD